MPFGRTAPTAVGPPGLGRQPDHCHARVQSGPHRRQRARHPRGRHYRCGQFGYFALLLGLIGSDWLCDAISRIPGTIGVVSLAVLRLRCYAAAAAAFKIVFTAFATQHPWSCKCNTPCWVVAPPDQLPPNRPANFPHAPSALLQVGNNGRGVAGASPRARILPCKALDANGWGLISKVIECISLCR